MYTSLQSVSKQNDLVLHEAKRLSGVSVCRRLQSELLQLQMSPWEKGLAGVALALSSCKVKLVTDVKSLTSKIITKTSQVKDLEVF